MCEIIVKAVDVTNPDSEKDRRGCYKRGYIVNVKPDGWSDGDHWAQSDYHPSQGYFVTIKFPGISEDRVRKYIQPQLADLPDERGIYQVYRRRLWKLRWDDLPVAVRNKLKDIGILTIKAGTYSGDYDFTWTQVKNYFRNQKTDLDETEDL